jgi:tRNA(Ile)-lysidine synthase
VIALPARVVEVLRRRDLLRPGATFVLACSGGRDSMVLAHVMLQLARQWKLAIHLTYVHHGLRPEADDESAFVRMHAETWDMPFHELRIDLSVARKREGGSLQDLARRLRYDALEELRATLEADAVLTAHHADDHTETILAHLLRGAGVRGMIGIRERRGHIVRPLLRVDGSMVQEWAEEQGVQWMHDRSNDSDAYRRNALRHHVLPALRALYPGVNAVLADTGRVFAALDEYIARDVERLAQTIRHDADGESLVLPPLKGYFDFERMLLLRVALETLRGSEASFDDIDQLLRLLDAPSGKVHHFTDGITAVREGEFLVLSPRQEALPEVALRCGDTLRYARHVFASTVLERCPVEFEPTASVEVIDVQRCGMEWRLRAWRDDDVMHPLGHEHPRRVKDVLSSQGLGRRRAVRVPVLEGPHGIIWLCGVRLDQRAALTPASSITARISFTDNECS